MERHALLAALHRLLRPRTYLEIGVNDGRSLTLSRARTVGVDPAFKVTSELHSDVHLVRATSDEFFARKAPLAHLRGVPVDLAFIDGMHLSEFALRDFINTEPYCHPATVVVLDDMLPRNPAEAARDRHTLAWAGDVYKVAEVLRRDRPDLIVLDVDTEPTGTVLVLGLDPASTALNRTYSATVGELVTPDPQAVPVEVLTRSRALDPHRLLDLPLWPELAQLARRPRLRPAHVAPLLDASGLRTGGRRSGGRTLAAAAAAGGKGTWPPRRAGDPAVTPSAGGPDPGSQPDGIPAGAPVRRVPA